MHALSTRCKILSEFQTQRGEQGDRNQACLKVNNEFLLIFLFFFWFQVAVLNGSAEQQLAILQNAEVHGIKFLGCFDFVMICSV